MATRFGGVFVEITGDSSQLDRELKKAKGNVSAFGGVVQGILQGVGQRLFTATAGAITKAFGAINEATNAASDLNETINKTNVIFGNSTAEILEWSKGSATALGQSRQQALEAVASFGALFITLGSTRGEAIEMSKTMVQLASDLASINNIEPEDALQKLQSGLQGEIIPLRAVNIFLSETAVTAKAAQLGFERVGGELTEQQKVLARYALILDQSTIAQGDFARTSKDLANATRITDAQFQNLTATLGQAFLPVKTAVIRGFGEILTAVEPFAQQIIANFARGLAAAVRFVTPALLILKQLFVHWLAPGSPPRLLPDLVRWGTAAATEFLNGWAKADFAGLQTLGSSIESVLRSFVSSGKIKDSDLVSRVIGSRDAIRAAISEFKNLGSVSQETLDRIARSAGPAGAAVAGLVSTYFNLQAASDKVRAAQDAVNRATKEYDAIIDPLSGKLSDVEEAQQRLRDQQRQVQLQNVLANPDSTAAQRESARLELRQIALQQEIGDAKKRQSLAVDTAQAELDAAKEVEQAVQDKFDAAQAELQQQVDYNNLLGEQRAIEERIHAEREAAAKQAQAAADALANALLQYQLGLSDTQGRIKLLRGELAKTQEGSIEYYQLLGQINDLEQQAASEAEQKSKQLYNAQLQYRLAVADSAGDLAILREELAKTQEGSVEYFNLLADIAAKEQELARGAGSGLGAGKDIEGATKDLQDAFTTLSEEAQLAIDDLVRAIGDIFKPISEITPGVEKLALSIEGIVSAIGELFGIDFSGFTQKNQEATDLSSTYWFDYGESVRQSAAKADKAAEDSAKQLDVWASNIRLVTLLAQGDWKGFWAEWQVNLRLGQEASNRESDAGWAEWRKNIGTWLADASTGFGQWLTDTAAAIGIWTSDTGKKLSDFWKSIPDGIAKFGQSMKDAGNALLGNLWDGLKEKWKEITAWWSGPGGVWTGFRNTLPFSEPKDPNSPLRGLGKAGESIVNQIQGGIEKASLNVNALAGAVGATSSTSVGGVTIVQNFSGNADSATVRQASRGGVLDALRAAGIA